MTKRVPRIDSTAQVYAKSLCTRRLFSIFPDNLLPRKRIIFIRQNFTAAEDNIRARSAELRGTTINRFLGHVRSEQSNNENLCTT